jgi:hypothetical protein
MSAFLDYAEFQEFWNRFCPETPFGREAKDQLRLYSDPAELAAIWDRTDAALGLLDQLQTDPVRLDRVSHHLKRLPRFPRDPRPGYTEVELFQFKKFLHNYTCLLELLGPAACREFGLGFRSASFAQLLDTGRQSAESFYVADEYSAELKAVRAELRDNVTQVQEQRRLRAQAIQDRWGLDFNGREFLVVARALLGDPGAAATLLVIEPYDDSHWVVRPLATAEALMLLTARERLLARERSVEEEVLETLSHAARQELAAFEEYLEAVREFDLAFARARLARSWNLTRPTLAPGAIRIEQGRFLPCLESCAALGTGYTPLDAEFGSPVTVIFGSNMGGKTIVLKTLAFLQLCAQTGLFVPAAAFATRVFEHFHYIGEGGSADSSRGLSGFGRELSQFNAAWADCARPTLLLFDEFARTTQSREAEALLSAAIAAMAPKPGLLALFSTHFRGVKRFPEVAYRRMGGLDRAGLAGQQGAADPADRIRMIARHMDYRLKIDDDSGGVSDALAVAQSLGLDPAIVAMADTFFNQR